MKAAGPHRVGWEVVYDLSVSKTMIVRTDGGGNSYDYGADDVSADADVLGLADQTNCNLLTRTTSCHVSKILLLGRSGRPMLRLRWPCNPSGGSLQERGYIRVLPRQCYVDSLSWKEECIFFGRGSLDDENEGGSANGCSRFEYE